MRRVVAKRLVGVLGLLLLSTSLLLSLAIDESPLPKTYKGLNGEDIRRAKQILHSVPDNEQTLRTVNLNEKDLNIASNYLLNHFVEGASQIRLGRDSMYVQIAVTLPESFYGNYLDFAFDLINTDHSLSIRSLKIGQLPIADGLSNLLIGAIIDVTPLRRYLKLLEKHVKEVRIGRDSVAIGFQPALVKEVKRAAVQNTQDFPSLPDYQLLIDQITLRHDPGWRLSLAELLQPLFAEAYRRSDEDTAVEENRAAIVAISSYVFKNDLRAYLPPEQRFKKEYEVFAYKRVDLPQHFIASAVLAATGSSVLGNLLGIDKEVGDAQQGGSGFSFVDLAADRAGLKLGARAVQSSEHARRLQKMLANIRDYAEVLPDASDLPENLSDQQFQARFDSTDSEAYQALLKQIDGRIEDLPIYREQ